MNGNPTLTFLKSAHSSNPLGQWTLGPFSLLFSSLVDQQVPGKAWATSNARSDNGKSSSELCPCEYNIVVLTVQDEYLMSRHAFQLLVLHHQSFTNALAVVHPCNPIYERRW